MLDCGVSCVGFCAPIGGRIGYAVIVRGKRDKAPVTADD